MARILEATNLTLADAEGSARLECALRAPPHAWLAEPKLSIDWPRRAQALTNLGEVMAFSLLPFAYYNGLDIKLPDGVPVETPTQDRIDGICSIWNGWYRCDRHVAIRAERCDLSSAEPPRPGRGTALMFSGGVDSLAGHLRHESEISSLVHVVASDIRKRNPRTMENTLRSLRGFAEEKGHELIRIGTNVRTNSVEQWGLMAHGCALMGPVLALGAEIHRTYLSSTHCADWGDLPWGSHPKTDPLIGTSRMQTLHDAYEISRIQKLKLLVKDGGTLLRTLRVCGRLQDQQNCGRCEKCVRTMAALMVLGMDPREANFARRPEFRQLADFVARMEFRSSEAHFYWCDILQEVDRVEVVGIEPAAAELTLFGQALRARLGRLYEEFVAGSTGLPRQYLAKVRHLEEKLHLAPESLEPLRRAVRSLKGMMRKAPHDS